MSIFRIIIMSAFAPVVRLTNMMKPLHMVANNQHIPFDYKTMDRRLETLERITPESIMGFYDPDLRSFSVRPGSKRFSVTSSLFCLESLDDAAHLFGEFIDRSSLSTSPEDERIPIRCILKAALFSEWSENDLFQVPLLLHTLLTMYPNRDLFRDPETTERFKILIQSLLNARPLRRHGQAQPLSEYLIYQCARAMTTLYDLTDANEKFKDASLPEESSSQLSLGLSRSSEVSFNELCRQLAYHSAGDRNNFDVMRLAYSLLTYVTTTNALSDSAGFELVPGEGPMEGTMIGPPNSVLVTKALKIFFQEQNNDGMWDNKGQPIYKSFRRVGRDVGNAFVFPTDTVASLLKALPADNFRVHMSSLEKMLSWIESNHMVEVIPNFCDTESRRCSGDTISGWSSPHMTSDHSPKAWSTAQTVTCLSRMRKTVRALMHDDVLTEFGGTKIGERPEKSAWNRLLDTDLGVPNEGSKTLKNVLEERIIQPFSLDNTSSSSVYPSYGASYSAILFGPPGTAKTTICEAIAKTMGWDFLVIDTSVFLADGLANVASRIRHVFNRLMELERCVILFDEIEEFCLDREATGLGMESRMLTTAMLTAINDLRRKKRSIFFLATNRLRKLDSAITRPGRFDLQLFVGAPNLDARCIQLEKQLDEISMDSDTKLKALRIYREFLENNWTENAMFMNYLEGLQFASTCAKMVTEGTNDTSNTDILNKEAMDKLLKSQAAVMTVRGSVRDEYIASMKLTRL